MAPPTSKQWLYSTIIRAFEQRYSSLGRQFAEELCVVLACYNMQKTNIMRSGGDYNAVKNLRRNLLLCWDPGWLKSEMMEKANSMLMRSGECKHITRITQPALFGSVQEIEKGKSAFIAPQILQFSIFFVTEVGQMDQDMHQSLLDLLEQGHVDVSMLKLAMLSDEQRSEIQQQYPQIHFNSKTSFSYHCRPTFVCATYDRKYLNDHAFTSRFSVVTPDELTNELIQEIDESPETMFDDPLMNNSIMYWIFNTPSTTSIVRPKLPNSLYALRGLTPRFTDMVAKWVLAMTWWGFKVNDDMIYSYASNMMESHSKIWR